MININAGTHIERRAWGPTENRVLRAVAAAYPALHMRPRPPQGLLTEAPPYLPAPMALRRALRQSCVGSAGLPGYFLWFPVADDFVFAFLAVVYGPEVFGNFLEFLARLVGV
jgi:hypothetical protein